MTRDYKKRKRKTRLQKYEETRALRSIIFFGTLSIILIFAIIIGGVPILTKMAIFVSDLKGTWEPLSPEDSLPPIAPRLQPLEDATNQDKIRLLGFSEAGSTVHIFVNNKKVSEVVADSNGQFAASDLKLEKGLNRINAQALDQSGNQSEHSKS